MCELLVGLGEVNVLAVAETESGLRVTIETRGDRPVCAGCGGAVKVKDRDEVPHADLPCFGRPTVLVWRKIRWECARVCGAPSFIETAEWIAAPRQKLTDRAGRWATVQVGRRGRPVSDVADELDAGWDPVMDAVAAYGQALIDDPDRFGDVEALGLDETLRARTGPWRTQQWSTQIVDVRQGQLLDVVEGRTAAPACAWLAQQPKAWRDQIQWATLDLSGPYRRVFDTMLPDAAQVADPFHVHKLANTRLDECRRRVQNETLGHRGRKGDPLYRARRLLTKADERLDDRGRNKLLGLLDAGDPRGEVRTMWHAKQVVRSIYEHRDQDLALEFVHRLSPTGTYSPPSNPVETGSACFRRSLACPASRPGAIGRRFPASTGPLDADESSRRAGRRPASASRHSGDVQTARHCTTGKAAAGRVCVSWCSRWSAGCRARSAGRRRWRRGRSGGSGAPRWPRC